MPSARQADFARATQMQADYVAKSRIDQTRADRDRTEASVKAMEAGLVAARANVDVLQAQKREAESLAAELRTAVDRARRDLDFTVIRAPFDGVVGNKAVEAGAYVAPGTRIAALVPLQSVRIDANFKETQVQRMRPGQPVTVTVDAYPDREIHGVVEIVLAGLRARCSACCRPTTRRATSPRSSSACPSASACPRTSPARGCCGRACRRWCGSIPAPARTAPCSTGPPASGRSAPRAAEAAVAVTADPGGRAGRAAEPPLDRRRMVAFLCMVFGMFMAILDIQIVSASLERDPGRPLGLGRRDPLGPDQLPDRRGHLDPALRHPVAGALDALDVRDLGRRLHRS